MIERVVALASEVLGPRVDVAGAPVVGVADSAFAAELAARCAEDVPRSSDPARWHRGVPRPVADERIPGDRARARLRRPRRPAGQARCPHARKARGAAGIRCGGSLRSARHAGASVRVRTRGTAARRAPGPSRPRGLAELEPPAERVDHAAFVAKALADELQERLDSRGLACTRIAIEAETEHGEHLVRLWRHEGGLTPAASPSGRAGSSTGGCTPRNGRRVASRCCASCPTRSVRLVGTRWGSGEAARSPTNEPHARWRVCKVCSASTRCRCPRCAVVAHRASTSRSFPSASPSPGG